MEMGSTSFGKISITHTRVLKRPVNTLAKISRKVSVAYKHMFMGIGTLHYCSVLMVFSTAWEACAQCDGDKGIALCNKITPAARVSCC